MVEWWRGEEGRAAECKVYVNITAQIENQCVIFSFAFDTISTQSCPKEKRLCFWEKWLGKWSSEARSMQHLIGLKCQAAAERNAHIISIKITARWLCNYYRQLSLSLSLSLSPAISLALRVAYIVKFQFAYHKKMSIPQQIRLSAACNDKNVEEPLTRTMRLSWHGVGYGLVSRVKHAQAGVSMSASAPAQATPLPACLLTWHI